MSEELKRIKIPPEHQAFLTQLVIEISAKRTLYLSLEENMIKHYSPAMFNHAYTEVRHLIIEIGEQNNQLWEAIHAAVNHDSSINWRYNAVAQEIVELPDLKEKP